MKPSTYPVPDGEQADWKVETFEISEQEAAFANLRAAFGHPLEAVTPGVYKKLTYKGGIVMSNTPMELRTHRAIIRMAKGNVLLNGLGLGLVLGEILQKPEVAFVQIVEREQDVIDLVWPTFRDAQPRSRVRLAHADAFAYRPDGIRWNAVWHDIWNDICEDNLPEMKRLHAKYARRTDWQESWSRQELLAKRYCGRY